jgi:glycosyltransferase involved in cell wall biosynthesis
LVKPNNPQQIQNIHVSEPLVSIVITTKNEEVNIENCIRYIKEQKFKNIELIVVDNFSTDKTVDIAKKYTRKVFSKGNERSSQRNCGANVAQGKYLMYVDADMILSRSLIEVCVLKCEGNTSIGGLYVPEEIVGRGFWIRVRNFERSFYTGTVIDAVRFIRRELFIQAGGFDESLIGPEDWDFDKKIRNIGRTSVVDTPLYHNEGRFNRKRYLDKKVYYADGIKKYVIKWGKTDLETKKQTGFQYRLFGVFFENGKWRVLFRSPVLTIAMYFLRFQVAIKYLRNMLF